MVVELISKPDRDRAKKLIEDCGLTFEPACDNLVAIFEGSQLAGVGARDRNIFKMLAITPDYQGGGTLAELVSELTRLGYEAGYENFFVFTPPANMTSFEALNFTPLVVHPQVALLEFGGGLPRYLQSHRRLMHPGHNGAVVVNCNPFTLGHRYLIEEAAAQVDTLYVFVVREDRSVFPFEVRLHLVREGTKDLANVVVLDSSHYAVSAVTFPSYFLKNPAGAEALQMELDLLLFARQIAPFFNIGIRFIGSEPYCRTTRQYSQMMQRILAPQGVETVQIERRQVDDEVISAYRVRHALRAEAYETVRRLVPQTTLEYLLGEEARDIRNKLRTYTRRH